MDTGYAHARFRDLLYRHGHGYPFWFPEPNDNLPADQRAEGMRVGDVGILTDDGGFEYLWNIHLPKDHPHNTLAPSELDHIVLDESKDIRKFNNCFDKDTAITSTSVKKREIKADGKAESGPAGGIAGGFEFTAEGNSGAILTLPQGGVRKDANKLNVYMQQARKNAVFWYQHINQDLQRRMKNGALYLVTGTDKCSSWGVASFATSSESHGLTLKFTVSGTASSGASFSNSWSADFGVEHRAKAVNEAELSQCVFTRGYTISLRDKLFWQMGGFGVRVTSPDGSESRPPFFGSMYPYSRSTDLSPAPSNVQSTQESRNRDTDAEADSDGDSDSDADADVQVMRVADSWPQKSVAALIGDALLYQNPDAVVAIVHDDDWIASTRNDDFWETKAADDPQSDLEDLVYHAVTHSLAVVVDGVCTFAAETRDESSDMPTTSIHEDALQGTLNQRKLARYLAINANVLEEKDAAQGRSPLALAAVAGHADVVELLLQRGAKADALSRDGETPLLLAIRDGPTDLGRIVKLLLAKTPAASVDATTARDKNNTPLMYAVTKKDIMVVRDLRYAGASVMARNDDGRTAADMASRSVLRAGLGIHKRKRVPSPGTVNSAQLLGSLPSAGAKARYTTPKAANTQTAATSTGPTRTLRSSTRNAPYPSAFAAAASMSTSATDEDNMDVDES